jgi:transcriptional regulator with XRE-family HTH domain
MPKLPSAPKPFMTKQSTQTGSKSLSSRKKSLTSAIGRKIRLAREEMGITQADLAYRVGISTQSISAFEGGRIHPDRKYLTKIAQFTHRPLYFFTGQKVQEILDRLQRVQAELTELTHLLEQVTEADGE